MTADPEKEKRKNVLKVVLRRLPPFITWEELVVQLDPVPQTDFISFVPGNSTFAPHNFARCYFSFTEENDVLDFSNRFNRYVFVDNQGNESTALVELAMFQKVPKKRQADIVKDDLCGVIEQEVEYKKFLDDLETERSSNILTLEEQVKRVQLKETNKENAHQSTPLTEHFVKKIEAKIKKQPIIKRDRDDRPPRKSIDRDFGESVGKKSEGFERKDRRNRSAKEKPAVDGEATENWLRMKKELGLDKKRPPVKKELPPRKPRGPQPGPSSAASDGFYAKHDKPEVDDRRFKELFPLERPVINPSTSVRPSKPANTEKKRRDRPEREIYRPQRQRKPNPSAESSVQ